MPDKIHWQSSIGECIECNILQPIWYKREDFAIEKENVIKWGKCMDMLAQMQAITGSQKGG